jgi:protein ImuB
MTLADARARYPALLAIEQNASADRDWLERMGQDCIRYTPHAVLHPPDGIGLDITGATHLFGGEQAMVDLVMDRFMSLGMTPRSACGSTMETAQALAHYASWPVIDEQAAILALPSAALGLAKETICSLQRAGLNTVGAVAARPMAAIAARFGMEAVTAIQRLVGGEHAPTVALKPPQPLRFERRFADPVTHQHVLANVLHELMQEAAHALEDREHGGRRLRLELQRSDGAAHKLVIETSAPTRDPALILRLFDERIGTLTDPLDPGFGYDSMVVTITVTEPLASAQLGLHGVAGDGAGKGDAALSELIDRLSTRLGPDRIHRLVQQDSHVPEQAQLAVPAIQCPRAALWPDAPLDEPPTRPLFLFNPPQPIEVMAEVPDNPPRRFRWRRRLHEVRLYEGPERIASEWWRRRGGEESGSGGLTRDYYRIEDVHGRRFWIFRHGLYTEKPDPHQRPKWYLHGLFA